ncbi:MULTISPECIES: hypothetical protein [unclassified Pseudodesulfovibrio]|uniref:hypothetical protein n=1 Tax=unclassified Pseudodesulfovibrio TaxID=2661612 RepID=UPI000FEBB742|nr:MULTISPECIES: hypothetical protein [unclassified Pseudodesulfovibrio]MCJ2166326.1 hypothetical protein [Pseudodesulfovibrio sp. S3-i]RWU02225.1 hypothetical protein DWB63_17310 [Pseudodesulfovibrio sp. S3]
MIKVQIASDIDNRENIFVELWMNDHLFAEVINERGQAEVIFYNNPDGGWGAVPVEDVIKELQWARKELSFLDTNGGRN